MENDVNEFFYPEISIPTPQAGNMIISEPMLSEPYFSRSAVYLIESPESGGFLGLAMNKETSITLKDLMPEISRGEEVKAFCGGPVEMERMFILHKLPHVFKNSYEMKSGIYVGADLDTLIDYLDSDGDIEGKLRLFLGYSGWTEGQLEAEIRRKSWALNPNPDISKLLEGKGLDYWQREVRQLGEDYRSWLMVPPDPSFN